MKIGLVGFGKLGQYIYNWCQSHDEVQVVWVWNRSTSEDWLKLPTEVRLEELTSFADKGPLDLIVEVAHPSITRDHGVAFVQHASYFVGSPTVFSDAAVEQRLRAASAAHHSVWIPSGALWGAVDVQKMSERENITALSITMSKHPSTLKVTPGSVLFDKLQAYVQDERQLQPLVLYEGSVRTLCPLAPNNVNTMACAALAAHSLGFDGVQGRLVADKHLQQAHVIDIDVRGRNGFTVTTRRYNPARVGAVTGQATYVSFVSSLLRARGEAKGFNFC